MLLCLSIGQLAKAAGQVPPVSHHTGALALLLISPDGKEAGHGPCLHSMSKDLNPFLPARPHVQTCLPGSMTKCQTQALGNLRIQSVSLPFDPTFSQVRES